MFTPSPAVFNTRFRPRGAGWTVKLVPLLASTAMGQGAGLYWNQSGVATVVTDATANFAGILLEPVAATDADYAVTGKLRKVAVPASDQSECEFQVGAGTFAADDVGKSVKFENSISVDVDDAGTQVRIVKYLSATRGVCTFNLAVS